MRRSTLCHTVIVLSAVVATACGAGTAHATDWEFDLDARLVTSDAGRSPFDGGLGDLRYGENRSGLELGRARFAISEPLGELWTLRLDASAWGNGDKSPVGLTEAYLQFRPYPRAGYRLRIKAGAFHAPISLENRASGWDSPYTVSYSALNSWLGEELRTVGLEAQLDWLGTRTGHGFDLGLTGGVFGWNDPAGAALAYDGFMLTDRQTPLFGRVGRRIAGAPRPVEPFHEIDHRTGLYGGVEARYLDRVVLRALRYDNRADPTAYDPSVKRFAWHTRFDSAGLRVESGNGWTAILQWLDGETYVAPGGMELEWPFTARFALLSKRFGKHTLSVRYDKFEVRSRNTEADGTQNGHAWTTAYVFQPSAQWRFTLEWLQVVSDSFNRHDYLGAPALATDTQIQLAIRYSIGSLVQ
jgi:hypothetical protein